MDQAVKPQSPWLCSAVWDGFWMLSGIWLLVPLFAFAHTPHAVQGMLIAATLLLWLSHRFATTYNAFCTPAYRNLIHENRMRFLAWPLSAILATFAFVFAPNILLPLDTWGRVQALGTIFFLYNSYHFGVQHYGVLSIYRVRAGQGHSGWLKRYEKIFCVVVGTILVAIAQARHGAEVVYDSIVYHVWPREFFMSTFSALQVIAPLLVVVLATVFYMGESRGKPLSWPKIFYVTGLALQGMLAYFLKPISFLVLWGVQHWLVSVALGAHMAQNDTSAVPATSRWYGFWDRYNKGFWPTVFVLCLASVVLTPLFQFAVHPEKLGGEARLFSFLSPLLVNTLFSNLFIAMNFSSVYVHFIMDRAVFRFSDPAIRKVSVPLLFAQRA